MLSENNDGSRDCPRCCCCNALNEGFNLLVLGEFLVEWTGHNDEQVHRKEYAKGGGAGSDHSSNKVTNEGDSDYHRAGCDHGNSDGVEKLSFSEPVMFLDHSAMEKRNDSQAAAKHKQTRFKKKQE